MNVKEYITSGILELYVAGALSEKGNLEVHELSNEHPEIHKEIQEIETTILELSKIAAPVVYQPDKNLDAIMDRIDVSWDDNTKQLPIPNTDWKIYMGWAASVVLLIAITWLYNQNTVLSSKISIADQENGILEKQLNASSTALKESQHILLQLRDKNITSITTLNGQDASPEAFAKVYWNHQEKKVYIDALGLPEPPEGMVYQVWSITNLNPLTPSSIGLIDDFEAVENKVFVFENKGLQSVAYGITLEPIGGSETPTLEQLYTFGVAASS
ncbi:anti-sigma factor [Spongiimicrobium salis]|uniref:anti-sigma factor n=1 Tax=Spongiimicrobium salis TaxID=1667022 RepID=UPI00374D9402